MHAFRLAAALAALPLLSLPAFAASSAVTGELRFSDVTLKVFDLDPADAYLPVLTLGPAGSFDNTASASAGWRLFTDWSDHQDSHRTEPLPNGGLLDVGSAQAALAGASSSVQAERDGNGARIALHAASSDPGAGVIQTSINSLTLRPKTAAGSPGYSFTIGARSYATFSMRVDGEIQSTGIDGVTTIGGGLASWEVRLKDVSGPEAQTVSGSGSLGDISPTQQMSFGKQVSYSILNTGTEAMNIGLYLNADIQVWAAGAPTPAVPEPGTWMMVLAGIGLAGSAARARRHSRDNGRTSR